MKKRNFLATIAMVLAFLTLFNTTSVAVGVAADAIETHISQEAEAEENTFHYPEKVDSSSKEKNCKENELRLPYVGEAENQNEANFGKPIAVDEHTKTYKTGDRHFKTVYSEIPNTYEDAFGKQTEYNNTLVLKEQFFGKNYYEAASSDVEVKLPAEEKKNTDISFEYNDVKVKLSPLNGNYSKHTTKENAILYNDVFDGIDVQYTLSALGMKEDIILNKYVDHNEFTYKVDIKGAEVHLEDGVLNLYKKGEDTPALIISAPMMSDAAGNLSEAVSLSFEEDILTVTADSEWIASPERAYPIKIDPNLIIPKNQLDVVSVSEYHKRYAAHAYGYVGHLTATQIGVPGAKDLGRTRMYFAVNEDFSKIPEGAKINSATLRIYQYTQIGKQKIGCYNVDDPFNISKIDYLKAISLNHTIAGENALSDSKKGYHEFDIRETVNNWIRGLTPKYGLCVKAEDESRPVGAFFTPYSTVSNAGQGTFTDEKAPQIIIDWEVPNPVDPNYPLNNTSITLRPIIETNRDGMLHFYGIFADGVAKPGATVHFALNDSSKGINGTVSGLPSYKFPDSSPFQDYFPKRATKYKDIQSNWQTPVPFTQPDFDTIYYYTASASKDGVKGNEAKSDEFLIYKIKQYDILPKIASYYGVPLEQIMFDNRVQDTLLIENNTIIVRNPTKNGNRPYNPGKLDDSLKRRIDSALMGRGKHCEFGFEPINLNTGNFYVHAEDIAIPDYNGNFSIERTYNSKNAAYNSIFGRGWEFAYSESLSKTEKGEFVYKRGDGSTLYFIPDGNGGYTSPTGYYLDFQPIKVATKKGDFGGDTLEPYDVYEYEIKDASGAVKRFDSMGLLTKITDAKGFVTVLSYDKNRNLSAITSPAGTSYHFAYTGDGYVEAISLPNGKQLHYTYDADNNLTSFRDAAGNTTTYTYDTQHQMTNWADGNGQVVNTNEYDSEGRVTKQIDGNGNVTTLSYASNQTTTTDANGNVIVYQYDDNYKTTKITYADGTTEEKLYDAQNNLAETIDRSGNHRVYTYDKSGNVLTEKRFDGAVKSYTYNADNQLLTVTDFNGAKTQYVYSGKDLVKVINPDASVLQYTYDAAHRMTKSVDARGNVTNYRYDGIWLSEKADANGAVTKYFYNAHGQVVSIVDALGQTTRFVYDDAGRKVREQTSDGAVTEYRFDPAGNVTAITDAKGNVFTFVHDANGNILKAFDPYGNAVLYTYDGLNNRLTETDPAGKTVTYTYDSFSKIASITDADGKTTVYEYDTAGNIAKVTDPKGNVTAYQYDLRFDTVSKVTDAMGGVKTYAFDTVGNITHEANGSQLIAKNEYDLMHRVIHSIHAAGLMATMTYDANGNVLKVEDNTGRVTSYTYDSMNRLTKTVLPNGAVLSFTYDALDRMTSSTDALGNTKTFTYNASNAIASVTDALERVVSYEYDLMGNKTKFTAANGGETSYEFDALDRVTKETDPLGNYTSYAYDLSENIASVTDVYGNATTYEYNGRNLPTKVTDALGHAFTFVYDDNGNQTEILAPDGTKTVMEYDGLNRLTKKTDAAGLVTEYKYNSLGQLVLEKNNAGKSESYTYTPSGQVQRVTNALGEYAEFSYDLRGNTVSVRTEDGNVTKYAYDSVGNIVSSTDAEGKVTHYQYDLNQNFLSKEDAAKRVWTYAYDAANRLTSETNPLGEVTAYQYNTVDAITKITNAKGIATESTYDAIGNILSLTDGNGNKTSYTYDALYRLIEATAADGSKEAFLYDAVSNLLSRKDALGNVTKFTYDSMNRMHTMQMPTGGIYTYAYDAHGNQTGVTDPLGNKTSLVYNLNNSLVKKELANGATYTYAYDVLGRIVGQTAPEGLKKTYAYDKYGNLQSETDQSNRTTSYAYDKMHRLLSSTNPASATTKFAYDERGNLKSVVTPKGYTTNYEYDVLDRISKSLDPTGRATELFYDAVGNLEKTVENGKRTTSYTYDNVNNLTSTTNPLNQTVNYTYDSMNRMLTATDLMGNREEYTYDLNGQLTSLKNVLGGISAFTYDGNGNLLSATDAEGRKAEYTYDLADRLTKVKEADAVVAEYSYDSVGNLTTYKNGNDRTTEYTYNLLGQMTSIKDPLGYVQLFTYDVNAMLESVVNPDKSSVYYDYDVLDQLISKSYDNDTDAQALYGFDADGNRISMDDVAGENGYEYDEVGKIIAVNLASGAKIFYTYDEFGNLQKLTYPDGTAVTYYYNDLDQLIGIVDRNGKATTYERDANGNVIGVYRPNDTRSAIERNEMGAISKIVNYGKKTCCGYEPVLSEFRYTYDKSGLIASETAISGCKEVTRLYAYDNRGQLVTTSEIVGDGKCTSSVTDTVYTYDLNGNRTSEKVSINGNKTLFKEYKYNDNDQMTRSKETVYSTTRWWSYVAGYSFTTSDYDTNGNLVKTKDTKTWKTTTYSYDNENRLKAVKENSTLLMAALYDGDGERIFRLDNKQNPEYLENREGSALNTYFGATCPRGIAYDTEAVVNEMLIPNDISVCKAGCYELTGYINDINTEHTQVLMEYGANGRISNTYEYGEQRNSATINGVKGYYTYDGRGSVRSMTGQLGGNIVSYTYDTDGRSVNSNYALNNPYRYNAEYTDTSTGNQYLRARYYSPKIAHFLTKDTYLGEPNSPLSQNRYAYVQNDPINYVDPSGHLIGTLILGAFVLGGAIYGTYKAIDHYNQQSNPIRNQQSNYEKDLAVNVEENVSTAPKNLQVGNGIYQHYNSRDKKVVTFTDAAAYFKYKKLCEDLEKLDKNLAISIVHNTLDAVGVIPGAGEIADSINGTLYLAEGDTLNAGLSFMSCIPVVGDTAGKGSKVFNTAIDNSDDVLDVVNGANKYNDDIADIVNDSTKHLDEFSNPHTPPKLDPVIIEYKSHGDPKEFSRQLQDQQNGLNSMSAGEIKNNIDIYRRDGRPNEAQKAIREYRATHNVPKRNSVLHGPDMCIGGNPTGIIGFGDSGINSSIGRQNAYKQNTIYDIVSSLDPNSPVNFKFVIVE